MESQIPFLRFIYFYTFLFMPRQLNREFINNYYGEMANELEEIFELFLQEIPTDINEIKNLLVLNKTKEAANLLHKIIPSFSSIGLPQLSVKLQLLETYIKNNEVCIAVIGIEIFESELSEFIPAILKEYIRLKEKINFYN